MDQLARIDRAGLEAAEALAGVIGRRRPLADVEDDDTRFTAVSAFSHALGSSLEGATLAHLRERLRAQPDRLTHDAAHGRLSYGLFVVEAEAKGTGPTDALKHPTIAYLDRLAKAASEAAIDTYQSELAGQVITEETYRAASQKALDTFLKTLGEVPAHDVWAQLQRHIARRVSPAAGWTILLTSGAGLLASLLLAPRAIADMMSATATIELGLDQDFTIVRAENGLTFTIGGAAHLLPAALADGHLWEQTAACFRAELRATAGYGPASLTATATTGPEGPAWSVMAKLSLVSW